MKPHPATIPEASTSSPWFVCPQSNPRAEARSFFFPYAGGGPAAFNKWSAELPHELEGWIAHYPGRGSRHRELPIKDPAALVESLSEAIQPLLDRPFVFFGHSLGALVAFELARLLRRNDLPQPKILFISACGAPHLPDPHPAIHALPDSEFLEALQQFNGVPSELLNLPDAMPLFLPILRADFEIMESYHYTEEKPPLDCPIVVFGGLDDPRVSRERLEAWSLHTNSGFQSRYVPGDHFFINPARESIIASIAAEMSSTSHPALMWSASPPSDLDLASRQVDIWRASPSLHKNALEQLESTLSVDEIERASRFHFQADRDRFILAHGCLRDVLARYLHCEPRQLSFSTDNYGKPALADNSLEFNIAHSGDFVLVAIARGRKVGVDVERMRQGISSLVIARQYFSKSEVTELEALPLEQKELAFFNCWTRKEAYIKAQGFGLSLPLESFDVSLTPNEPAILRATRPDPEEAARWSLQSLEMDARHAAAVAAEGKALDFRLWDWKINY